MLEDDYKATYKLIPVISSSSEMTTYGIDLIDKQTWIKQSLRIFESEELEFGTPEYEYWAQHSGEEEDTPKIHVWEVSKCHVFENEEKEIKEIIEGYGSSEFYRGDAIYYPSEEYDEMFEKNV